MASEVQFGGDYNAFPLWGKDDRGRFDVNAEGLRRSLSPQLAADLDEWAQRWAQVDGGDREDDDALTDALVTDARTLAERVGTELGPECVVSLRWDEPRP